MATTSIGELFHRSDSIDPLDIITYAAFALAVPALVGIGSFSLYGYSMSMTLLSASGMTLTLSWAIAAGTFLLAYATNHMGADWDEFDDGELVTLGAGLLLLVGIPFVPILHDFVVQSKIVGTAAAGILGGAYIVLAYY